MRLSSERMRAFPDDERERDDQNPHRHVHRDQEIRMTDEKREGEHPARAYGVTGGGFAEGQAKPEQVEEDRVGSFSTGEEDLEKFPEDEQLGSFGRGQETPQSLEHMEEGTFGTSGGLSEE
jgi:hypothetical protein